MILANALAQSLRVRRCSFRGGFWTGESRTSNATRESKTATTFPKGSPNSEPKPRKIQPALQVRIIHIFDPTFIIYGVNEVKCSDYCILSFIYKYKSSERMKKLHQKLRTNVISGSVLMHYTVVITISRIIYIFIRYNEECWKRMNKAVDVLNLKKIFKSCL